MARRIEVASPGGPEAMKLVEVALPDVGPEDIRIRHTACGLNFIDVYHRSGAYPLEWPSGIGMEAAGIVEAVGAEVAHLAPGDRVAYAATPPGAYATERVMPAKQVCRLPDSISLEEGAAMMLQGLTTQYLFRRTVQLEPGDKILFHAAAGGVGLIACQWARAMGVELIGAAGSDEKCALAREHGAAHVINYRTENFVERVDQITSGVGVRAVMDGVGKDTWDGSLECLQRFGVMISFGAASGPPPAFNVGLLGKKGSLFVTRPTLFDHIATRADCQAMADDLFDMVSSGKIAIRIDQRFPLADAAAAHVALEARRTTGATILTT